MEQPTPQLTEKLPAGILSAVLSWYLSLYFLVPYKPFDWPLSFHTMVLGLGFAALLPSVKRAVVATGGWLAPDLVVFYCLVLVFGYSSLIAHFSDSSWPGVQAYLVSFLSFVFVRLTSPVLPARRFFFGGMLFLVISGILMFLQVNFAGGFYVAGFFGETNFGRFCQAWGFANTHILAGGMLAWLLTVLLAKYSLSSESFGNGGGELILLSSLGLGAGGLFYTLSRGAWLGLVAGIFVVGGGVLFYSRPVKYFLKAVSAIFFFLVVFRLLPHPGVSNIDQKLAFVGNFAVKPAETVAGDASVNTRARAWGVAVGGIEGSPLWGIGISKFPSLYEKFFPAFYSGDNSKFDPNPRQIPHNSYLYFAVEAGIIPALALLVLVVVVISRGIIRGDVSVFPFAAGLLAVCAWILTCDYINERIFWIALGLVAGLGAAARTSGSSERA